MDEINWQSASVGDRLRLEIIRSLFADDSSRLIKLFCLDKAEMRGSFSEMRKLISSWSSQEEALAKVALTVWFNEEIEIDLVYLARCLDDKSFARFIKALNLWRSV